MNLFGETEAPPVRSRTIAPMVNAKRRKDGGEPDNFQTPPSALEPLWPYLRPHWRVWEPCCGKGNLVRAFEERGHDCIGTDIHDRPEPHDMLLWEPRLWDVLVTNPPYSIKTAVIRRCYDFRKPFALLMPLTALEGRDRQTLYRTYGLEVIFLPRRINFLTPSGTGGGSWFATAWFCYGLQIGRAMTFWTEPKP